MGSEAQTGKLLGTDVLSSSPEDSHLAFALLCEDASYFPLRGPFSLPHQTQGKEMSYFIPCSCSNTSLQKSL